MDNYLDILPLSDEEKYKLTELGIDSPIALLSMIKANPSAFEDFLGLNKTVELENVLKNLVRDKELQTLKNLPSVKTELGAIISRKNPDLKAVNYDLIERERLFKELKFWKSQDSSSDIVKEKISQLTEKLNEILSK